MKIFERLFAPARFEYLWLVPLIGILVIYAPGSIIGLLMFHDQAALTLSGILLLGALVYLFGYLMIGRKLSLNTLAGLSDRVKMNADFWKGAIVIVYFLMIAYTAISAPKIALFEALRGASASEISIARQMLFVTRVGPERILVYLNAFLSSVFLPYVIATAYIDKKKYRHLLLFAFALSLTLSVEKALAIKAFLPLIILAINRWLPRRSGVIFAVLMVAMVMSMTALSKIGDVGDGVAERGALSSHFAKHNGAAEKPGIILSLLQKWGKDIKPLKNRFELVNPGTVPGYIVNRIMWIPYITAYDWILYFERELDSQYLTGRTSMVISVLTRQQKYNMSGQVFAAEYGSDATLNTGSSNAIFLVDMFVNFGWLGVAGVAFVVMLMSRLFERLGDPAAIACYYYFIYQLMVGSFFGVMFSDGVAAFLVMICFIGTNRMAAGKSATA